VVALDQGPLRGMALQQAGGQGHLTARHVGAKTFAHDPEWKVTALETQQNCSLQMTRPGFNVETLGLYVC